MKQIFMYLNIPWQFIKQRPQFLAEKLSTYFEVIAYYNRPYKKCYIVDDDQKMTSLKKVAAFKIPRKNSILNKIDNKLQVIFTRAYIKNADYIWIMHPHQYDILKEVLEDKKVIYDCMDDYSQFPHLTYKEAEQLKTLERQLVERADLIFFTSETLMEKLKERYIIKTRHFVVNNALEPCHDIQIDSAIKEYLDKIPYRKLVYVGAIAPWFDFELVEVLLKECPSLSIVLFGPSEGNIPRMDRLYHYGKIPHKSIYTAMSEADGLIMPFKINELIEAVDPIKVYEYIASEKFVLVPYYKEMEKFKDYVEIYNTYKQAIEAVKLMKVKGNKRSTPLFTEKHTWEARAQQIARIIDEYEKTHFNN